MKSGISASPTAAFRRSATCPSRWAGARFSAAGANGAGKSTAIECVLGTRRADSGSVRILGLDPRAQRKTLFERVGVQFQEAHFQDKITVEELCETTRSLYREAADGAALLARFGLAGKEKRPVSELSGGQRQRLFIVLALLPPAGGGLPG